ncbi:MAG: dihydrolipoyl dehydrogenase [Gammaproteobacteria bacterium]|nr:dihydrolipoyl dehydrogenase [Gammaproteobacteria bacterium]MCF6362010.1 dihydrolipoyl dehydrogenase [Gammaproteobacteria bacterium]
MTDYDVIVLGGGPGGYVAAIRCAQLGLKTACIDDGVDEQGKPSLGGVCLNVGCIPSKALLETSHHFYRARHDFPAHGIRTGDIQIDVAAMQRRKQQVVTSLTGGIALLFAKHRVTHIKGHGCLLAERRVRVIAGEADGEQVFSAGNIIVATGSTPVELAEAPFDGERIVDSTGALAFAAVPKRLGVIGGGVIGLELGSVWSRLGAKTTLLVRGAQFLAAADQQLARAVQQDLQDEGLNICLGAKLVSVKKSAKQITVTYADGDGEHKLQVDKLLVAAGRRPNTGDIGAEDIGLKLDVRGFIDVDADCRTNLPGIFAIGDVVRRGPMLAHKASEEGVAVAERIAGQQPEVNYATIPFVIYTWPEIAWVGRSSEQLQADGIDFESGVFPFLANGRAHASGDTRGMVKVLADARTDRILGVHIYGANASELIAEAVVAMEFSASAEDLARTIHAHPTLSEAIHEAALAVDKRPMHI